jgi:serpin B
MNKILLILLALVLIPGLVGCSPGEVRADRERITDPEVSEAEMAALVEDNTAFAFELYKQLKEGDGNLFYSPYSLSLALAMTYAGASGETERQMANVLHFDLPQEKLHPAFNSLDSKLASRDDEREDFRLSVINALWGQKDYTFHDDFLVTLAENYDAGMKLVDYIKSPEDSRLTINDRVSRRTDGKIAELIPPGQGIINYLTRLVLTNTIYFSAEWEHKFLEANYTKNRPSS